MIDEFVEQLIDAFYPVKITNLKTGEVTTLPLELVDKIMEQVKEEWISGLLYGYEI